MPVTAKPMASHTRGPMRSPKKNQLSKATTVGMAAMMTPADTAVVMLTPNSMQMVNKKLPRKDSRKIRRLVAAVMGGSPAGLRSQCGMAKEPMPKRSQASKATGNTAIKGLDKAT